MPQLQVAFPPSALERTTGDVSIAGQPTCPCALRLVTVTAAPPLAVSVSVSVQEANQSRLVSTDWGLVLSGAQK